MGIARADANQTKHESEIYSITWLFHVSVNRQFHYVCLSCCVSVFRHCRCAYDAVDSRAAYLCQQRRLQCLMVHSPNHGFHSDPMTQRRIVTARSWFVPQHYKYCIYLNGFIFFAFGNFLYFIFVLFVSTEQAFYRCDRKGREEDRDRETKRKLKINNLEKQEHNNRFVNKCWIYSFVRVYFSVCLG